MKMLENIWEKTGTKLVIITHDRRVARMADRQFVIVDGILSEVIAG
jgi:putative ABC transport system ATP-binding protein